MLCLFFFFNAPPTSVIYPLSLHDALPISVQPAPQTIGDDDHGGAETTDRLIGVHQQPARRRSRAEHVEIRRRDPLEADIDRRSASLDSINAAAGVHRNT